MKEGIHPNYREVCFLDLSNGFKFVTRSCANTKETIKLEDGRELTVSQRGRRLFASIDGRELPLRALSAYELQSIDGTLAGIVSLHDFFVGHSAPDPRKMPVMSTARTVAAVAAAAGPCILRVAWRLIRPMGTGEGFPVYRPGRGAHRFPAP